MFINRLKSNKSDGSVGLSSDHFIHACGEFHVYDMCLYFLMLSLCMDLHLMTCISTILPIPTGKNTNVIDFGNHRGFALSSIFGKVLDFMFRSKFGDNLCTSYQQFGFKR